MTLPRSFAIACCILLLAFPAMGQSDTLTADTTGTLLDFPNVFTPNGDGINDYFEVRTDGETVYEFSIFTRTGTRVFYSRSPQIFWDGRNIDGIELKQGVYYYTVEETGQGDRFQLSGFLHMFR